MIITEVQLRKLIKEQLLNEAQPGIDGLGADADAYVASVKSNPNNPEKWDKELIASELTDQQRQAIAKRLKQLGAGIEGIASFIGDIAMMPIEARVALESDLYQYFALDSTAEQKEAALESMKETGPNFAWEAFLGSIGVGLGAKAAKKAASTGVKTAKKAPKTAPKTAKIATKYRNPEDLVSDAVRRAKEGDYEIWEDLTGLSSGKTAGFRGTIGPDLSPTSPTAIKFKEKYGIPAHKFHHHIASEMGTTYKRLGIIKPDNLDKFKKLSAPAQKAELRARQNLLVNSLRNSPGRIGPEDRILYRGLNLDGFDAGIGKAQHFTASFDEAFEYGRGRTIVAIAVSPDQWIKYMGPNGREWIFPMDEIRRIARSERLRVSTKSY